MKIFGFDDLFCTFVFLLTVSSAEALKANVDVLKGR